MTSAEERERLLEDLYNMGPLQHIESIRSLCVALKAAEARAEKAEQRADELQRNHVRNEIIEKGVNQITTQSLERYSARLAKENTALRERAEKAEKEWDALSDVHGKLLAAFERTAEELDGLRGKTGLI